MVWRYHITSGILVNKHYCPPVHGESSAAEMLLMRICQHAEHAQPLLHPTTMLTSHEQHVTAQIPAAMHKSYHFMLTHSGRVMHICVSKLTIIGSDNGLSPDRRQAIIWTNTGIFLIGPLGTNFSEILIANHTFSFKKMHLKRSSAKWRPFCVGLNVSTHFSLGSLFSWQRSTEIRTWIRNYI